MEVGSEQATKREHALSSTNHPQVEETKSEKPADSEKSQMQKPNEEDQVSVRHADQASANSHKPKQEPDANLRASGKPESVGG